MKWYYDRTHSPKIPYLVVLEKYLCPSKLNSADNDDRELLSNTICCPRNAGKYNFKSFYEIDNMGDCELVDDSKWDSSFEDILTGKSQTVFDSYSLLKCWPIIWLIESGSYYLQQTNNEAIKKREMYVKFDKELKRAQQTFIDNAILIKKLQKDLN